MTSFTNLSYNNNMDLISQDESKIYFERELISNDFIFGYPDFHFGIINLKINKIEPISKKRHIVFTLDCSGSMQDTCMDGRTKMEHCNHTLINMILYFSEHTELCIHISVFAFDGNIYSIIENEEVSGDNVDKLIQDVKKIRPRDMTNIEKALQNAKKFTDELYLKNNNCDFCHILMTDGDVTFGKELPNELAEFIPTHCTNVFIGFGIDHNAYLLKELSNSDFKNKYYFIDALEKAGLVYGEILHSFIYKLTEKNVLYVSNGLLYDWKNNIWVEKLNIGDLTSGNNKLIHVLSKNPLEFTCKLEILDNPSSNSIINIENSISINKNQEEMDTKIHGFIDLTKYKYRQKTLQLLFDVNEYNFRNFKCKDPIKYNLIYKNNLEEILENHGNHGFLLKEKMNDLLNEMQIYLEQNESIISKEDYGFIKMLCDDIYICLQTFDTKYSGMYSCARQASQGLQRGYSATRAPRTKFPNLDMVTRNLFTPKKQTHNIWDNEDIQEDSLFQYSQDSLEDDNYKIAHQIKDEDSLFEMLMKIPNEQDNIKYINNINDINKEQDSMPIKMSLKRPISDENIGIPSEIIPNRKNKNLSNYKMSEQIENPYLNDSILNLMNSCSASFDEYS